MKKWLRRHDENHEVLEPRFLSLPSWNRINKEKKTYKNLWGNKHDRKERHQYNSVLTFYALPFSPSWSRGKRSRKRTWLAESNPGFLRDLLPSPHKIPRWSPMTNWMMKVENVKNTWIPRNASLVMTVTRCLTVTAKNSGQRYIGMCFCPEFFAVTVYSSIRP